jgi:DNA (cytosine-5)-methyltransferase 1
VNNGMAHINGPNDGLRELALFAGAGGGILGGKLLGWRTVCAVEWEPYPAAVLARRQDEGFLAPFPIWDDVQTFDGKPWRGLVDVVSGGFPCQDISSAGKGAGITGERSGMWSHMARIIGEVRPRYAFVENSPVLTSRGLDVVLGDLAALGYDAEWGVLGAVHAGAPHNRERIWIVAHAIGNVADSDLCGRLHGQTEEQPAIGGIHAQRKPKPSGADVAHASVKGLQGASEGRKENYIQRQGTELWGATSERGGWWKSEPNVGRVADGVAVRVDRLKAIGNGQVPQVAELAWHTLHERLINQ